MHKEPFVSSIYRSEHEFQPAARTPLVILDDAKRQRNRARSRHQRYASTSSLAIARATYRQIGEKHPADEASPAVAPQVMSNTLLAHIVAAIDARYRRGVNFSELMDYVLDRITPMTDSERHAYRKQIGETYERRRSARREEEESLWVARLRAHQ